MKEILRKLRELQDYCYEKGIYKTEVEVQSKPKTYLQFEIITEPGGSLKTGNNFAYWFFYFGDGGWEEAANAKALTEITEFINSKIV